MVPDLSKISGLGDYTEKREEVVDGENTKSRTLYKKDDKAFLVVNSNTIELRTDQKLAKLLEEKYESVMESRYFGRGGIEIVIAGNQLKSDELADLISLSYNLS